MSIECYIIVLCHVSTELLLLEDVAGDLALVVPFLAVHVEDAIAQQLCELVAE